MKRQGFGSKSLNNKSIEMMITAADGGSEDKGFIRLTGLVSIKIGIISRIRS